MMVTRADASRFSNAALTAWVLGGCVSTAGLELESGAFCASDAPSMTPWSSIVLVTSSLRMAGEVTCSGVAVAPNLVLTNVACLVPPPGIEEDDLDVQNPELFTDQSLSYAVDVDYSADCLANDMWSAIEDGDFSERITRVLEPSVIRVDTILDGFPDATSTVRRILHSRTESRCWDSLAVLVLDQALSLRPALLRVDENTDVGSPVVLSGFAVESSLLTRHEIPATIESVTYEANDGRAPPRSMLLSGFICEYEHGGGVFAEDTGALLGIITSERDYECVDEEAGTIATRLAPFRRLLAESATLAGYTLPVERRTDDPSRRPWPPCRGD
jgi:hypothetical protein